MTANDGFFSVRWEIGGGESGDAVSIPQQCRQTVEWITRKIDEIPHVTQVRANAFVENLLRFFPYETDDVQND